MKIIFTDTSGMNLEMPKPSLKTIPEWYKSIDSYTGNNKKIPDGSGNPTGTIKKCIPVFDAITSGYIIELPTDVWVCKKENGQHFEWPSIELVSFHVVEQAAQHPLRNEFAFPKWMNPWSIKTPKGYSCLFVQPFHRESVFTILPGIVDTDQYFSPVNFPFVFNDSDFEGIIPQGTPIAQVIPFKRDAWNSIMGNNKNYIEQQNVTKKLRTKIFDRYKNMFWTKKEYK